MNPGVRAHGVVLFGEELASEGSDSGEKGGTECRDAHVRSKSRGQQFTLWDYCFSAPAVRARAQSVDRDTLVCDLDLSFLVVGAAIDAIPSIDDPNLVSAKTTWIRTLG